MTLYFFTLRNSDNAVVGAHMGKTAVPDGPSTTETEVTKAIYGEWTGMGHTEYRDGNPKVAYDTGTGALIPRADIREKVRFETPAGAPITDPIRLKVNTTDPEPVVVLHITANYGGDGPRRFNLGYMRPMLLEFIGAKASMTISTDTAYAMEIPTNSAFHVVSPLRVRILTDARLEPTRRI